MCSPPKIGHRRDEDIVDNREGLWKHQFKPRPDHQMKISLSEPTAFGSKRVVHTGVTGSTG